MLALTSARFLTFGLLPLVMLVAATLFAAAGPAAEPAAKEKPILVVEPGGHTGSCRGIRFTPDGKHLISAADRTIRVWNPRTGETKRVLRLPQVPGADLTDDREDEAAEELRSFGYIHALDLSADGQYVAVTAAAYVQGEHWVYLIDWAANRVARVFKGPKETLWAVALSRDGRWVAACGSGPLWIWNRVTGQARALQGQPGRKYCLAFAPDGNELACGGTPDHKKPLVIWNVAKGKIARSCNLGNRWARSVAWSPDGQTIASAVWERKEPVVLWNRNGSKRAEIKRQDGGNGVAFSDDSRFLLAGRELFRVDNGKAVVRCRPPTKQSRLNNRARTAVALSPNGKLAAWAGRPDEGVYVWNAAERKQALAEVVSHGGSSGRSIYDVSWHPKGSILGWGNDPEAVQPGRTFDLAQLRLGLSPGPTFQKAVHEQGGRRLAPGGPHRVDVLKGKRVLQSLPLEETVSTLNCYTFVGANQVAAGQGLGVYLFDLATGKRQRLENSGAVRAVAPAPSAQYLAVGGLRQVLRIYTAAPAAGGRKLPLLSLFVAEQDWVAWTPEGYYAASPGGENLIGWTVNNGFEALASYYPAEQFQKQLYRPDIIRLLLDKGSVAEAVKAANAARVAHNIEVSPGEADIDKILPPTVALAVVNQTKLPRIELQVAAQQACADQPIKSLRLLVDGRPLPNRQGFVEFPDGKEQRAFQATWKVELPPGRHQLCVLARGKDDTPNASASIDVACPLPPDQRPKLHHLAVGINEYDKVPKLQCAANDAQRLAEALNAHNPYYIPGQRAQLPDQKATRASVLRAIDMVRQAAKPNDLFVFSFAGHGIRAEGEFYLLTKEADTTNAQTLGQTALSGVALREKLVDFPCQVFLILDACHAGAFGAGSLGGYRPASEDALRALTDVEVRVAVLCAALGHEEAQEKNGHGLFTANILRALNKDPHAFFDHETGELDVSHLHAFVRQEVSKASAYRQTPYLKLPLAQPPFVVTQFVPGR